MYLQLLFPFPLALAATARDLKWRILFSALYLFSALSLYVTQSRAGLIGLIAGTGACFLLLRFRRHVGRRAFLALAYTGLAFAALQVPIVYNHMASRPHTYWHRFNLFREAAKIIVANPVLGVGANNSTAARLRYAAPSPYESVSATGIAFDFDNLYPIHSQYLVVAAETGLVGFALGASFFLFMASEAMRLSKSENAFHSTLAIAVVSGYVALGCQLLADHFVGNAQHTTLALSTALIVAIGRLDSDAADLPLPSAPSCL
jgi:O-antigen ligase